jgi:hypothetical protein
MKKVFADNLASPCQILISNTKESSQIDGKISLDF